jgi:hypothetical protein
MAMIRLQNEEDFYLLINGQNEYFGRDTPTPSQPFTLNGGPVVIDVCPVTSEETQEVKVDFNQSIVDDNNVQYPLIVGGRPKSRRRN